MRPTVDCSRLRNELATITDPRGRQGLAYPLPSLLLLMIVGFLCGRVGLMSIFRLGRELPEPIMRSLGFQRNRRPCHSTLTETIRLLDPDELQRVLGALCVPTASATGRHIAIDGKTMCATKTETGSTTHVVSAFCRDLSITMGIESSVGKGMEIPDALALLEKIDLKGKVITGDAIFCQRHITEKIDKAGGDYVFPVKNNQKNTLESIVTAFEEPVFPPQLLHNRC
jgi:predicted transposase YbfD/YdcC